MPNIKVGSAYTVHWRDHVDDSSDTAWVRLPDIKPEIPEIVSIGYVVYIDKSALVLSHSVHQDECIAPMVILRAAITKISPLKIAK